MVTKKTIVIATRVFPFNTPMALRIRAFIKLFNSLGYRCAVVCLFYTGNEKKVNGVYHFGDVTVYSAESPDNRRKKLLVPVLYSGALKTAIINEKPSCIFSCSMQQVFPFVFQIAKRYRTPMVLESSEWYDPSTYRFRRIDIHYLFHVLCWSFYYPRVDAVVAISRLLFSHYKEHVNNVIRIPTILDTANTDFRIDCSGRDKIVLLFAGSLGGTKDSIKEFYEALDLIDESSRFSFEIIGVNELEFRKHIGEHLYEKFRKNTIVHGNVHQSTVSKKYIESDYGIFFRPIRRSSDAGFSTKLGEGMSAGTPFIVNTTGDIPLYLRDSENSFIATDVKSIAEVYKTILSFTQIEMEAMRLNARRTAETYFDFHSYSDEVEDMLTKTLKGDATHDSAL